jgi:hypothetical protein
MIIAVLPCIQLLYYTPVSYICKDLKVLTKEQNSSIIPLLVFKVSKCLHNYAGFQQVVDTHKVPLFP